MPGTAVTTQRRGRVLVITITREDKRNALNAEVTAGIDQAMNELEDSADLWCGILTGGPRFFSAGADLATGPGEPTPRGAGMRQRAAGDPRGTGHERARRARRRDAVVAPQRRRA
jgi:enoyl-CoA hydratase/carnithine racemase